MKDRNVEYPNRYKVTKVDGTPDVYELVPAPGEVIEEGTLINKANMLTDETAKHLGLTQEDPTVNNALNALNKRIQPAVLNIHTNPDALVTASKDGVLLSATADSSGLAVLYIYEFGIWTLTVNIDGKILSVPFTIDAIAIFNYSVTTDLEAASWDLISSVSETGNASSVWSIGDRKNINVGGVIYPAQIIDFGHDTKVSGGKAGITFQLVDSLNTKYQMEASNINYRGWDGCVMRTQTMNTLYNQLEGSLKSVIKTVSKLASAGNQSSAIITSSDKLFLLSEVEIFGKTFNSKPGEGTQYAWYSAGNSKIKNFDGEAYPWWGRSPSADDNASFRLVNNYGVAHYNFSSALVGVSFAFCV